MSRRVLITLAIVVLIIVVGMALSVRRSAKMMHRAEPDAPAPTQPAPAR